MNSYQKLKKKLEDRIAVLEKEKSVLIKEPDSVESIIIKNKFLIFDSAPKKYCSINILKINEKTGKENSFKFIEKSNIIKK